MVMTLELSSLKVMLGGKVFYTGTHTSVIILVKEESDSTTQAL